MAWKEAARRSLIGDKVILASTGGALWIRPKKLSCAALDELRDLRNRSVPSADRKDRLKRTMELNERHPGLFEGKGVDDLTVDDRLELLDLYSSLNGGPTREIHRVELLHGIGEHNFVDDKGELIGRGEVFDSRTVEDILEWGDLAMEISKAIEAYSPPLARTTAGTSATSPSGSSAEPSSDPKPEISPTVETPTS
jgi:hypothetical protein